ncbi:MAG TPA: bacillithiol biosynthesis cysteine-adding enzyme BshC [Gemmatimonadales bacterium]|jgi:bacillithiol biosynthesis cysteine-adding enzyme BshC|nr:bacillithiol biosynthesis cysteine-adding enzyme BshC [Gemmatimonadales bacterium]
MSLPITDTPLTGRVSLPALREAIWDPNLEPALLPAPGVAALLARLRLPGTLVVTTGQQPGLFTGPSYAVTKALSARAVAQELERRWQRPVVPLYWIPGDDHDLHEVATVSWLNSEGGLVTATLPPRAADAPLTPLWREPLGDAILPLLAAFEQSFLAVPVSGPVVAWLRRHYRPDASVAGAYGTALAELLAPFGILCLDSTHETVKRAAAPLLLRALEQAPALDRAIADRAAVLVRKGTDPGVPVGEGASLVFLEGPVGRDRLVLDGGGFQSRRSRTPFTLAELRRIAEREPSRLSGNVLLRPVLESALLPTVAYVSGPGELRYLPLAVPVYEALGITRQLPVPRWSGALLEPRVTRVLQKYGTTVAELLAEGSALEARIARQAFPEGTEQAFVALRDAIERGYDPVIRAAAGVDPTLERPAASARAQALHGLRELEKKLAQHARKRESIELGQIARARTSLRPEGRPQERVLSLPGFLARYGPELLGSLARHIEAWYGRVLEPSAVPF